MSYYSTQIRDGFGREIRVSKESAPIAKNAGLLAISTCLDRIRFLSTFETYISDSISSIRKPTSSRENRYLSSFFSRNFPKKSLSIIQLPGRRPGP